MEVAIASFGLGLLSMTSPCVLPLYPGFLAYLSGQTDVTSPGRRALLGPVVLAGVLTMMLALGAIIAGLAVSVGRALSVVIPLADVAILALGLALLLDRNPFTRLPQLRIPVLRRPLVNAYVYGLLYGPVALPCSGPLVVAIFALSIGLGDAVDKLWVFLWFGLGFGVPLLALSAVSAGLQRRLALLFARQHRRLNLAGGSLLVAVAVYDLVQNWPMIVAFYA